MTGYTNILVAVDLSPDSAFVLDKARHIAKQYDAALSLVHVMEPIAVGYTLDISGADFETLYSEVMRQARNSLVELGASVDIPEHRLHNVLGSPAREIRNTAKEIRADLVVVGGHGKHGFELLLGSTSSGVSHGVECDLLIVRLPH
ncbi:MAG: universal stress protein [Pseudomonadota bacterium]